MTKVVKTRGKVQEKILKVLQGIILTGMVKHLFEQPKPSHWNVKCGNSEYFHQFVCEYPNGCGIFGWSEHWWSDYSANLQVNLVDIVTSAIPVFDTRISKALNNCEIDDLEFQVLQELHLKVINKLLNFDGQMELETRIQLQKNLMEEINEIKKKPLERETSHDLSTLFYLLARVV